jgi:hypothetical protein
MNHRWLLRRALAAQDRDEQTRDKLSGALQRWMEHHLERCAQCRAAMHQWQETEGRLRAVRPQTASLPTERAQALFASALLESGVQSHGRLMDGRMVGRRRRLLWSLGLGCLGAVALLAVRLHRLDMPGRQDFASTRKLAPPQAKRTQWTKGTDLLPQSINDGMAYGMAQTAIEASEGGNNPVHRRRRHRRRHIRLYAALRRYHGRRHRLIAPPILPIGPQRSDDESAVAQTMPAPQEPEGRLVVTVTHQPGLTVEVTHASEETPGYASAACMSRNAYGAGYWQRCLVSKDEAGVETMQTQVAFASPGPQPQILVVQAVTPEANRPEANASGPAADQPAAGAGKHEETSPTITAKPEQTPDPQKQSQEHSAERPEEGQQQKEQTP